MADDHEHGSMDVTAQERTFAAFMQIAVRAVITIIVVLVLLYLVNG